MFPPRTIATFFGNEPQSKLGAALSSKDEDKSGSFATKDAIRDAIKEAFPELEPRQLHVLENLAEQKEDGRWGVVNIEKWGFHTLQEMRDQRILLKSIKPLRGDDGADAAAEAVVE